MIIENIVDGKEVKYIQLMDLLHILEIKKGEVPDYLVDMVMTLFMKYSETKPGNYTFFKFESDDVFEYFRDSPAIIDYSKYRNLSLKEIKNELAKYFLLALNNSDNILYKYMLGNMRYLHNYKEDKTKIYFPNDFYYYDPLYKTLLKDETYHMIETYDLSSYFVKRVDDKDISKDSPYQITSMAVNYVKDNLLKTDDSVFKTTVHYIKESNSYLVNIDKSVFINGIVRKKL